MGATRPLCWRQWPDDNSLQSAGPSPAPFFAARLRVGRGNHAGFSLNYMRSLWDRVRKAHVVFVTTGYLRLMEPIAAVLIKLGISANALTTIGTISTVIGGVAFALGYMHLGGFIIGLTAIADALDGVVARRTGQVTVFGAFYDSTLDRVADGALLGGLAYFYASHPEHHSLPMLAVTLVGIVGTYLISYARARAEALGINAKVGVMQRAERVILLSVPQAFFGLAFDGWLLNGVVILLTVTAWHTAILRINYVRTSTLVGIAPPLRVMTDKPSSSSARSSMRAKS
jgi:CDP-diacylglycerol---glycerol-3-phosphate 3-phosphatidyltransferase